MNNFRTYNLIGGWFCFIFAAAVYLLSIEPTASLWDCSEFIATSYKLEVGHPPGAPLFMMLSRFFAIFAPGTQYVGAMVNAMSALASAVTIMFLFWTITHFARRIYGKREDGLSAAQGTAVLGAGLIGAIAYTFTDTFWFSAVEGEVYALSSMFTAIAFWAVLKWENVADEPHADRWLVLIAYLTGLAIGVHLLNLLIIPSVVFIYYFKKYPAVTKKGIAKAIGVSALILVAIMYVLIPQTVQQGAFVDRMFVNGLGLPVNSGITFYVFVLFGLLCWGVYYTHKKGKVLVNVIVLCVGVLLLGYGSYASVIIRASANPPMNSNDPGNPYGLLSLLNRDQYGARPLIKGNYYSSPAVAIKEKTVYYEGEDGTYKKATTIGGYEYAPGFEFFFPRMYSSKDSDVQAYHNWVDIKGRKIPYGEEMVTVPTFGENLKFFFAYQLNFMYWRYFLWNFVGRQSDVQSTGEITDGNWLSGIKPIDELFLGPQDNLPSEMAENKGRNTYFFLPFLLGILGLVYQLNRDGRNFTVVMSLFIMTGVAIAVYLNSPPAEPRERDYVFAGSFYAFSVWIGLGVLSVFSAVERWFKKKNVATAVAATAVCAVVPVILGAQNWDDHDRSGRYVASDFGSNYLNSTLPNSIILNWGDNDTFPLWYAQEVEGVRTDVRVMNMSYLNAEWYVDQMKIKSNDSDPLPISLPKDKYTYRNEMLLVEDLVNGRPVDIKEAIDFVISDDPRTQVQTVGGQKMDYMPAKVLAIPVNKENALACGIVKPEDAYLMADTVYVRLNGTSLERSELVLLDILANFDWKRPIYFTQAEALKKLGLHEYLQADGMAYRLVPIYTPYEKNALEIGRVDPDYLYDRLMKDYKFGNVKDPKVNADHFVQNTFIATRSRYWFSRLADELLFRGDTTRALEVLDRAVEEMPFEQIRHSYVLSLPLIRSYYMAGAPEKGDAILSDYAGDMKEYIDYYLQFEGEKAELVQSALEEKLFYLNELYKLAKQYGRTEQIADIDQYYKGLGVEDR